MTPTELLALVVIVLLLLALIIATRPRPTPHVAVTKHVQPNGADSGSTGPFRTLGYAVTQIAAGDSLEVHGGLYPENLTHIPAGSAGAYTRIYATPGETAHLQPTAPSPGGAVVWLDGAYHHIEITGLILDGSRSNQIGVWLSTNNNFDVHSIRIKGNRVLAGETGSGGAIDLGSHHPMAATGGHEVIGNVISGGGRPGQCGYQCASYGVYVKVPDCRIEGNDIFDVSGAGVHVYSGGASPDRTLVRRNRIHDITRCGSVDQVWGVLIAHGLDNEVSNNVVYRIQVPGAEANPGNGAVVVGGTNTKVWHNTADHNNVAGVVVSNATAAEVRNNLVTRTSVPWIDGGSGTMADHNLFGGTDPLYVNADAGDFHLTSGSPAIDAGADLPAVPVDVYGMLRPAGAHDIGAAEYVATVTPPEPGPEPTPPTAYTVTGTVLVDLRVTPVPSADRPKS